MPCRFASSGTVATSRSASRAILALNVASNFLRDFVISVLHRLRQSRTLHTLTFGPISGVHFTAEGNASNSITLACTGTLTIWMNSKGQVDRTQESAQKVYIINFANKTVQEANWSIPSPAQ